MRQTIYQGRDWMTRRWRMAEALFALDGFHDLCLGQSGDEAIPAPDRLLQAAYDLYETTAAQCDHALADAVPPEAATSRFEQLWAGQEAMILLGAVAEQLQGLSHERFPLARLAAIAPFAQEIKECLKKLES